MSRTSLIAYCRKLPHATHDIKWKNDLVFSIGKKMFACFDVHRGPCLGFKTTPDNFSMLTRTPGIAPAPYAARFHWVVVQDVRRFPVAALKALIKESYELVLSGLSTGAKRKLGFITTSRQPPRRKSRRSGSSGSAR